MLYSPTIRLLLACLNQDPIQMEQIQPAQVTAADWQALAKLSKEQWITPLLYRRLNNPLVSLKIPAELLPSWRKIYYSSLKQNLRLYKGIKQVLRALAEQDIPVIPLKGIYLAEKVYGNIGLRTMVDADLLVQRPDLVRALTVLEGLGYHTMSPFNIEYEYTVMHHLPPYSKPGGIKVELHWTLARPVAPFQIAIDQVWQNSRPAMLDGVAVREMAPEDLLLHLCVHAAYIDCFSSRLRQFCDIALSIQAFRGKLDWIRLAQQARIWGAERSLFLALRVTQQLLGILLPEDFMESIRPPDYDPVLESWAITQIFHPVRIGSKLAAVHAPQPWSQRALRIMQALFPPPGEIAPDYPGLARGLGWPLAYLKNLGRVLQRNRQSVWKLIRKDATEKAEVVQSEQNVKLMDWQAGKVN
jgi:hypothetical protein